MAEGGINSFQFAWCIFNELAATRPIWCKYHTQCQHQREREIARGRDARNGEMNEEGERECWWEKVIVNKNSADEIKRNKMAKNGKRLMLIYCVYQSWSRSLGKTNFCMECYCFSSSKRARVTVHISLKWRETLSDLNAPLFIGKRGNLGAIREGRNFCLAFDL